MKIFDENSNIQNIDTVNNGALDYEYFWTLNLEEQDYMLAPLLVFEEWTVSTFTLSVNDYIVKIPTNWHVLIQSNDTSQLDIIESIELMGRLFKATISGPAMTTVTPGDLIVKNYCNEEKFYSPLLHKNQMVCLPINEKQWINISPVNSYNKYLNNKVIGDLIYNDN